MGKILEVVNRSLVLPGGSLDASGAYVAPLLAVGGGAAIAAATANQAFTAASAGRFGYLTDVLLFVTATAAVSGNISILDQSSGAVVWNFPYPGAPNAGTVITLKFTNPPRTALAGGQFFITTTGAGVTWVAMANGYYDNALGN
jgi:hypothetical protein